MAFDIIISSFLKKKLHFTHIQRLKIKSFELNHPIHFLYLNLFHFDCFSSDCFLFSSSDFWCQRIFCYSGSPFDIEKVKTGKLCEINPINFFLKQSTRIADVKKQTKVTMS